MRTENIFRTGGTVQGESLIGYESYKNILERHITNKLLGTGGICVIGLYRTGKSSLIRYVHDVLKEKQKDTIIVSITVSEYNDGKPNMYEGMLYSIVEKMRKVIRKQFHDAKAEDILDEMDDLLKKDIASRAFRMDVKELFETIKESGLRVLLLLDEFDSAETIFTSKADFDLLRTLTSEAPYSVTLVTVSRRPLHIIEGENPNNSTFSGIMEPIYIRGFEEPSLKNSNMTMKLHSTIQKRICLKHTAVFPLICGLISPIIS